MKTRAARRGRPSNGSSEPPPRGRTVGRTTGRLRRISPVVTHSGDRLLSEQKAGTQPRRQEPLLVPEDRGRDAHYWTPPARIRTSPIRASGSYLGCLTAKRFAACRTRLSAWITRFRLWVRYVLCWSAFPL